MSVAHGSTTWISIRRQRATCRPTLALKYTWRAVVSQCCIGSGVERQMTPMALAAALSRSRSC